MMMMNRTKQGGRDGRLVEVKDGRKEEGKKENKEENNE